MKAVLTVIGKDMVGILAKVASSCAEKMPMYLKLLSPFWMDISAWLW